jgi:hypothetical protein
MRDGMRGRVSKEWPLGGHFVVGGARGATGRRGHGVPSRVRANAAVLEKSSEQMIADEAEVAASASENHANVGACEIVPLKRRGWPLTLARA